jgi:hypothetical protein
MGSTVAVSVMPVGSGTVGLLPMNGYPSSPLAGGAAKPNVGCSGKPKCGMSAPAVGGGAERGGRVVPPPMPSGSSGCHWMEVRVELHCGTALPFCSDSKSISRRRRKKITYRGIGWQPPTSQSAGAEEHTDEPAVPLPHQLNLLPQQLEESELCSGTRAIAPLLPILIDSCSAALSFIVQHKTQALSLF